MAELAKLWFDNLQKIQGRMKDLNHLTKDGLNEFSKQNVGNLLLSDLMRGNLSQFCQQNLALTVPDAAYSDPAKTFLWFLNRISFSIEEAILTIFYRVAVKYKPALLDVPRSQVAQMTIKDVYGDEPINSSQSKRELHSLLTVNLPGDFYPSDGAPLNNSDQILRDVIKGILS